MLLNAHSSTCHGAFQGREMDVRCSLRSCVQETGGSRAGGGPTHTAVAAAPALEGARDWLIPDGLCDCEAISPRPEGTQPVVSQIRRVATEKGVFHL